MRADRAKGGAGHPLPFGICLIPGCQPVVGPSFKHDFSRRASFLSAEGTESPFETVLASGESKGRVIETVQVGLRLIILKKLL